MMNYIINIFSAFKGYPLLNQVAIFVAIGIIILAVITASSKMYNITFQIKNNFDNSVLKDNISISLNKDKQSIHFTPKDGIYSGEFLTGNYKLRVKPELYYQIVEPTELKIDSLIDGTQQPIYVNIVRFYSNTSDYHTESIQSSGSSLKQTSSNEITLYTIIESIRNSVGTPLEELNIDNFEVIEKYQNTEKKANVVSLKRLSSSSLNIIFVVDTSSSMNSDIPKLKSAMKNFIEEMRLLDNRNGTSGGFAILPVSGNSDEYNNIGKFLRIDNNHWHSFKKDLNWLNSKIDEFMASGMTPLYSAISLAMSQLNENSSKSYNIIICLSDGGDNASGNIKSDEIEKISKDKQIPIFSIGFGDNNGSSLINLKHISEQSKGEFYMYNDNINSVFMKIANNIQKTYELSWKNTGSKIAEKVDVQIKVKYKSANKVHETTINKDYILQADSVMSDSVMSDSVMSDSVMSKTQQVTQ